LYNNLREEHLFQGSMTAYHTTPWLNHEVVAVALDHSCRDATSLFPLVTNRAECVGWKRPLSPNQCSSRPYCRLGPIRLSCFTTLPNLLHKLFTFPSWKGGGCG